MLLAKGYPDIGWNPCGGERYLDFLRFAVFVNGEPGVALAWQEAWDHWLSPVGGGVGRQGVTIPAQSHRLQLGIGAVGPGLGGQQGPGDIRARGPQVVAHEPPGSAGLGESVEENANVVVRLLIRKPECFGPALRGEGGSGLLAAIEEAIRISEDPARDGPGVRRDRRREQ